MVSYLNAFITLLQSLIGLLVIGVLCMFWD
jgi:hypothetical protein